MIEEVTLKTNYFLMYACLLSLDDITLLCFIKQVFIFDNSLTNKLNNILFIKSYFFAN